MKITIDFETASAADLKKVGAWAYAEHPTTEILCCAFIADFGYGWVWIPGQDDHEEVLEGLRVLARNPDVIFEAHNAVFEQAIWHCIMVPLGMPPLPPERWDCTMARCLYRGVPAGLEDAAKELRLLEQKDMEGSRLTISLSKPMTAKAWGDKYSK